MSLVEASLKKLQKRPSIILSLPSFYLFTFIFLSLSSSAFGKKEAFFFCVTHMLPGILWLSQKNFKQLY